MTTAPAGNLPYLTPAMTADLIEVLAAETKTALVLCPNVTSGRQALLDLTTEMLAADLSYEARWSRSHERVYVRELGSWVVFRSTGSSGHRGLVVDLLAIRTLEHDTDPTDDPNFVLGPILRPDGQIKRYTA